MELPPSLLTKQDLSCAQSKTSGESNFSEENLGILASMTPDQMKSIRVERVLGKGAQGLVVLCSFSGGNRQKVEERTIWQIPKEKVNSNDN